MSDLVSLLCDMMYSGSMSFSCVVLCALLYVYHYNQDFFYLYLLHTYNAILIKLLYYICFLFKDGCHVQFCYSFIANE